MIGEGHEGDNAHHEKDGDLDSDGDDRGCVDDLIPSEQLSEQQLAPFSSSEGIVAPETSNAVLPVMIPTFSSDAVIAPPTSHSDSNGSDAIESLEQTSLDLSFDASETPFNLSLDTTDKSPESTINNIPTPLDVPTNLDTNAEIANASTITKKTVIEVREHSSSNSQSEDSTTIPPPKRSKVIGCQDNTFPKDPPLQLEPIEYIDLTQDDSPEDHHNLNKHQCTINKEYILINDHHITSKEHQCHNSAEPQTPNKECIILGSSDSESSQDRWISSESCSPNILPPTPGRENVQSILTRDF